MAKKEQEIFVRKREYSADTIKKVQDLCAWYDKESLSDKDAPTSFEKMLLPIPNQDGIICYYEGKPIVQIGEAGWNVFGKGYNQYFETETVKEIRKEKNFEIYTKYSKEIRQAIGKGLPNDKERCSEQYIANRALCDFKKDGYVICGMETSIPKHLIDGKTKPEIDMVAIHPEQRKILLIEYKCQYSALVTSKKNIVKHCEDYAKVLTWIKQDKEHTFIREMLNAYEVMCRIYGKDCRREALKEEEFSVEIVFLVTNQPCKAKDNGKGNITARGYASARTILEETDEKIRKVAEESYYITYESPEQIAEIPNDIVSERYKGIDKLIYPL